MCVCVGCVWCSFVHVQCLVERVLRVCMIRAGEHVPADTEREVHAESGSGGL